MGRDHAADAKADRSAGPETDCEREAPRFTLMLRAGKLVGENTEFLCILRDVSATGMRVKLFHPLPPLDRFEIELLGGERYTLLPIWEEGGHAGFRFGEAPVEVDALLAAINAQGRRRQVRLQVEAPALVHVDGVAFPAHIENISQHGARITCATFLALGQRLRLEGQGVPPRTATVSWRRDGAYGLVLEETFRLEELAQLNARLQESRLPAVAAGGGA